MVGSPFFLIRGRDPNFVFAYDVVRLRSLETVPVFELTGTGPSRDKIGKVFVVEGYTVLLK